MAIADAAASKIQLTFMHPPMAIVDLGDTLARLKYS
ncbi:hypothetical protein GGR48_001479 [Sphingomonas pseudosanguinis]|uniref:Uncharacterized protein n=1 Tax=Sphingomonas pseudosanguinis TaxID=413712 RepID=A0A7W6AED4_9SPHN|nr:hypothetical protein [Sphingomonas pseudosanguinis]